MKHTILPLLFLVSTLCACKKDDVPTAAAQEDNGCVEWKKVLVTDHSGYSINSLNIPIINALFLSNNINKTNFRYVHYFHDSTQTYFAPYIKFDDKVVQVKEFTNGLEIFSSNRLFQFRDNILAFTDGKPTKGTSLNAMPKYTSAQIRAMFLGHIQQFDFNGDQYKDSCFSAQFGYFNLNTGVGNLPEKLIKAWKITPKESIGPSEYPIAYYQDNDGKLIFYNNGIESFH